MKNQSSVVENSNSKKTSPDAGRARVDIFWNSTSKAGLHSKICWSELKATKMNREGILTPNLQPICEMRESA